MRVYKYNGSGIVVRRALDGFGRALAEVLSPAPESSSWLGSIEPRAKISAVLVGIVGVIAVHQLMAVSAFFASIVALALWSGVNMKRVGRVWAVAPLFSLAVILPATLSLVSPGRPALVLWHHSGSNLAITWAGLEVAVRFLLRTMSCVTLALLLVTTTEHSELVDSLRRLGMPKAFGMTLMMMSRYLSLMLKAAQEIHLAKLSRTIAVRSTREEQRWAAAGMGILFRRTHRLAGEVNLAMISRGFNGEVRLRQTRQLQPTDLVAALVMVVFTVVLIVADRMM